MFDNFYNNKLILKFSQLKGKNWLNNNVEEMSAYFSIKGQTVNILGFGGHMVSVAAIQFYFCITKSAIDSMYTNGYSSVHKGCSLVPIKLYLQKEEAAHNLKNFEVSNMTKTIKVVQENL